MADHLAPRDEADLVEIVRDARAKRTRLAVEGRGTRAALGRPIETEATLSLAGLTGVTLYEPAELVMTALPGTPLSEIRARLAENGQELAFDPIEHAALFGHEPGSTTIAAAFAINASGPRRPKIGAARDHLLGFRAVNGLGESFKSGGRVMKNVTGFDLSKLVCGSFGTLAVLSEVTFKVMPRAATTETLAVLGLPDDDAGRLMREASGLPQEVDAAAHLPASVAGPFAGTSTTLIRLDGPPVSVASREADLVARWRDRGEIEILGEDASRRLWDDLREARPIVAAEGPIWRLSLAPSDGPRVVAAIRAADLPLEAWVYDWAGGLVWLAFAGRAGPLAARLRAIVAEAGGHATLIRADEDERRAEAPFHPQPAPLAALAARVARAFDPDGILSPGRMTAIPTKEA
ncbi:MAG: FAD-binding protein [Hyphomicrobiales bacterium]|nr:FAD-binding protein [Hyphomicrobiales bacterium]